METGDDALRAELLEMFRQDQELRNKPVQDWDNQDLYPQDKQKQG